MRALCWNGVNDLRVETVPDPSIVNPRDAIFICCGQCWYCQHDLWSLCDNTNPNAYLQQPLLGYPTAGI